MLKVIKKWQIIIFFKEMNSGFILFISDDFYENVLRKLADLSFELEILEIQISPVKIENQTGTIHSMEFK